MILLELQTFLEQLFSLAGVLLSFPWVAQF